MLNLDLITQNDLFFLIAGPCVVENESICLDIAEQLVSITNRLKIPFIYKASFKKANRSSVGSFTGIGDKEGLEILQLIRRKYDIPVTTDIHTIADAELAARYVDVLQIPAFLCRQTDLLLAAGQTGKYVNVKKGQFLSPEAMQHVVQKFDSIQHEKLWLTERGTTFGYHELVVDFRSIPIMQGFQKPVVLDCTHANQRPNQVAGVTGGRPEFIEPMAKAGIAMGVDGLFIETHPNPREAKSDGANMLPLSEMEGLLEKLIKIRMALK